MVRKSRTRLATQSAFPAGDEDLIIGREIVYTKQNGQLMAAEVTTGSDSLQLGALRQLFQIHPPRPDGTSFALAPDGERLLVWSNKQRDSETVVNLIVNWPAELEGR